MKCCEEKSIIELAQGYAVQIRRLLMLRSSGLDFFLQRLKVKFINGLMFSCSHQDKFKVHFTILLFQFDAGHVWLLTISSYWTLLQMMSLSIQLWSYQQELDKWRNTATIQDHNILGHLVQHGKTERKLYILWLSYNSAHVHLNMNRFFEIKNI